MFHFLLPPLAGSSVLCFGEEVTTMSEAVRLGFDVQGKQLCEVVGMGV